MSELKATTVYDAYWKANSVGEGTGVLVYLKSEADKMIAHNKYKRCLAMHDYCLCELEFAFRDPCIERSTEGCVRWRKWANRWYDLAEMFKEAK